MIKANKSWPLGHADDSTWKDSIRPLNMTTSHNRKCTSQVVFWSVPLRIIPHTLCQCPIKLVRFTFSFEEPSWCRGALLSLWLSRIMCLKNRALRSLFRTITVTTDVEAVWVYTHLSVSRCGQFPKENHALPLLCKVNNQKPNKARSIEWSRLLCIRLYHKNILKRYSE